jgi:hypothetical protein
MTAESNPHVGSIAQDADVRDFYNRIIGIQCSAGKIDAEQHSRLLTEF